MSLPQCRSAIAKTLRTKVKGIEIYEHGGQITLEEIKRLGKRMPAALVTCLGVRGAEMQGSVVVADTIFAVYCLAQDAVKAARDVGALLVACSILAEVPSQRWDSTASQAPKEVTAANLFTTPLDKEGFACWAVRWRQRVDLVRTGLDEGVPFETFFATFDVATAGFDDNDPADTETTTDQTELEQS